MGRIQCPQVFTAMQKNNAFCSICTMNYSAYAGTLNDSLKKVGHNEPHYVLIVDYDVKYKEILDKFNFIPIFLDNLEIPEISKLIEKYSAFELSNVLKPFFIEWLLKNHSGIKNLIYLDTDIFVFSPLHEVIYHIEENPNISVVLTPHLIDFNSYQELEDYRIEQAFFPHGLYNGGFYVLKNNSDSLKFLDWHKKKLLNYGYSGSSAYMYVDQKILDFAPIIFKFVDIYHNAAYNIAHWNYFSGLIEERNNIYYVGNKRMVFFHFSQLPKENKDLTGNFLYKITSNDKKTLEKIILEYLSSLEKNGNEKIKDIKYGYSSRYIKPSLLLINPLNYFKTQLDSTKTQLDSTKTQLAGMYTSREWKAGLILQKIVKIVIPKGSLRRKTAIALWRLIKFPLRFIVSLIQKIKTGIFSFQSHLIKFKPRKKRKINKNSKKIIYIGHSYHNKTKSTEFLINYLKQSYDVKVISDESWLGKSAPDLSFIDESYLGVIFFQLLPPKEILSNIKNDNITYFPMYDQTGRCGFEYWNEYRNLKIINFSKTLHEKLFNWGFESMYVQYFPELKKFIPGNKDEAFFWQRLTAVNINSIAKLFGKKDLKLHIHKAIDPDQQFIAPSVEVEKRLHITYSDWFETREEMLDLIKQKGIYVAPREYEGIGLSFLEAMAMGKAVIAVNNPTMNEYITHGKNGYLFDLKNPKEIDLSNIEQVQKNTYEFMKKGYEEWEKNKHRIIDFIKKP